MIYISIVFLKDKIDVDTRDVTRKVSRNVRLSLRIDGKRGRKIRKIIIGFGNHLMPTLVACDTQHIIVHYQGYIIINLTCIIMIIIINNNANRQEL
jgi:hypothetical protein